MGPNPPSRSFTRLQVQYWCHAVLCILDLDPSLFERIRIRILPSTSKKVRKGLILLQFLTFYLWRLFKCTSKSNEPKTDEKSRIRIRTSLGRIRIHIKRSRIHNTCIPRYWYCVLQDVTFPDTTINCKSFTLCPAVFTGYAHDFCEKNYRRQKSLNSVSLPINSYCYLSNTRYRGLLYCLIRAPKFFPAKFGSWWLFEAEHTNFFLLFKRRVSFGLD